MTTAELPVLAPLPNCRWRGPATGAGRFGCASPKLIVGPAGVTADVCRACPFANHPPPARAVVPPAGGQKYWDCAHRGAQVRSLKLGCGACSVYACGIHGECLLTPQAEGPNLKTCQGCPDREPKAAVPAVGEAVLPPGPRTPPVPVAGPVRLDVSANGIGDHLMAVAVASGWRAANPGRRLTLVAKSHVLSWAALFDGYDELTTVKDRLLPDCWPEGFGRGGRHFVEVAARAPWWKVPALKPLPDEVLAWAELYRRAVVLAPFSLGSGSGRNWLASHWRVLADELRAAGRRVVVIGAADDAGRLAPIAEALAGESPERVAALVRASGLVISNESGMAHLAGAVGAPVLVLAAQLDGRTIHGRWPHAAVLQGPLGCSGCRWTGPQFRDACHSVCASLQAIAPEAVLAAARQWLDCEWFPDPDLRGHLGKLLVPTPPNHRGPQPDRRGTVGDFLKRLERFDAPLVVETGCQRMRLDYGAGMSSTVFGLFLRSHGGRLFSLDLDERNVETCRGETAGLPVDVVHTDSRPWLRAYAGPPIRGLYLDSCDTWVPGYEDVCLDEAQAALPRLDPAAPILIDDTFLEGGRWHGKGARAVPWLLDRGWRVARHWHQVLLVREDGPT